MYPPFSVPSPHLFPSYPPICFPRRRHLYKPTSIAVGILTVLMSLYVLSMGRVGFIPLDPAYTPIPAAMSIVATGTVNLTYIVVLQPCTVSPLPVMTMAPVSILMFQPPV